jgi:hypothetical protein
MEFSIIIKDNFNNHKNKKKESFTNLTIILIFQYNFQNSILSSFFLIVFKTNFINNYIKLI